MSEAKMITPQTVVPKESAVMTPMTMIERAITAGAGIDTLEKLMALQERWEASEARKDYNEALSLAKAEFPPIIKHETADFGQGTSYNFENLAKDIDAVVDPVLAKHGLSCRYKSKVDGSTITVTCVIAHKRGHSEETSLPAPADTSGKKNPVQAIGSTVTYLQRYTKKLALGLAAAKDTDGYAPQTTPAKGITADEYQEIAKLLEQAAADETKFLRIIGAESLEGMTHKQYLDGKAKLLARIKDRAKA